MCIHEGEIQTTALAMLFPSVAFINIRITVHQLNKVLRVGRNDQNRCGSSSLTWTSILDLIASIRLALKEALIKSQP